MAKTKKYEVWMAFENYIGELTDKTVIAVFFSKNRAMNYVEHCQRDTITLSEKFGIDEK
jgi:hypothetical protein